MPARFHSHTHLHLLCRQVTVEFLRFLAVLQSPLLQFPGLGIYKSNLLKARVIIASYNDHVRLPLSRAPPVAPVPLPATTSSCSAVLRSAPPLAARES